MEPSSKLTLTPLYEQVKKSILERIIKGEWDPGSFLPSEIALADEYGVSQGTLRKALNALSREKRLVRYQGKGTAVAILDENSALFPFFLFCDRQGQRVYPTSMVYDTSKCLPDVDEQKYLEIDGSEYVIRIERVRFLNEIPVINERVSLSASNFPNFNLNPGEIPNTLYEYFQLNYGITISNATEYIEAINPDAKDIERLGVLPVKPLLCLSRISYDLQNRPVEYRISHVDTSHDFVYKMELK